MEEAAAELAVAAAENTEYMQVDKGKCKQEKEMQGKAESKCGKLGSGIQLNTGKPDDKSVQEQICECSETALKEEGNHATQVSLEWILPGSCTSFNLWTAVMEFMEKLKSVDLKVYM
eukprot:15030962-Ditylum_brightwellii.AAC.1